MITQDKDVTITFKHYEYPLGATSIRLAEDTPEYCSFEVKTSVEDLVGYWNMDTLLNDFKETIFGNLKNIANLEDISYVPSGNTEGDNFFLQIICKLK